MTFRVVLAVEAKGQFRAVVDNLIDKLEDLDINGKVTIEEIEET